MKYLIHFSYDGTNFCGYQKQPGLRTVEDELEKALFSINNHKETKVTSSGRTDAGVHALDQVANFDLEIDITLFKLKCALNSLLPEDIHVFSTELVDDSFHSRYMVDKKTYKYIINCGEYNPIERNYVFQYNKKLDIEVINRVIKDYIGVHDFESFVSAESIKDNYTREIYEVKVEFEDDKLTLYFSGNGFMKYQVRNMVGVLIKISEGKYKPSYIKELLEKPSRDWNIYTAPANGLYLESVFYDKND